jgi:hypothetical protein
MPKQALVLVARFALVYGLLVGLCAVVPVYAWIESAAARVAAAALRQRAMESRTLELARRGDAFVYVYDLRVGAIAKTIERPFHKHAFVIVLYLALVLATPKLDTREFALAVLAGGAVVFLLCVAMLMSDLELWERDALAAAGYPGAPGPFPISLGFIEGLHRTAAAGLLPLILWTFFAASRAGMRARTRRATSAA